MKILAKPLKGESFEVEMEPEDKVEDVKKRIAGMKPEFPAELQKLICAGKILADGSRISDCAIKPSDFIVVMVSKPKAPAAAAATAPAATATAGPSAGASAPAPAATPSARPAGGSVPVASAPEAAVAQLMEMGFPRDQVEQCLRVAFNNPDRAVEYLTTGIPPHLVERSRSRSPPGGHGRGHGGHGGHGDGHGDHDAPGHDCSRDHGDGHEGGHGHGAEHGAGHSTEHGSGHGAAAPTASGGGSLAFPALPTGGSGGGSGGGGGASAALQELRNHPRFQELSGVVRQNPEVLPQMLTALAQTSPDLVQAITDNQEEFLLMLHGQEAGGGDEVHGEDDADDDDGDEAMSVGISEADQDIPLHGAGESPYVQDLHTPDMVPVPVPDTSTMGSGDSVARRPAIGGGVQSSYVGRSWEKWGSASAAAGAGWRE
eukprot:gnl/TRDRNA2_/TRDRNA2_172013_c5_seq2.p1 gnl/TRDRNA2_/TRDRNA2_172013_c5~~gnl/TRDRNA2_/TRDRNA2_172013_c5_seq2.p1  ORF type:complete len:430 (+),score=83.72 gnl/TRDRNA2_/TRDRNA2_172013_c5_seq2:103-1392(+)